jgi:hypothetical protein
MRNTTGTETLPPSNITHLRSLIDDLLHRKRREIRKLEFVNRPRACHRSAYRDACATKLRNRCVAHAVFAEPMDQVARYAEGTTIDANILAHDKDAIIRLHGLSQGFIDGLGKAQFARGHAA